MEKIQRKSIIVICTVLSKLINKEYIEFKNDENLVIEAIRRSNHKYLNKTIEEIGTDISTMDIDSLRGFSSNIKGIYHELLFAKDENSDFDGISAELFSKTNHPGADVEFKISGIKIGEAQLKATDSVSAIKEHQEKYPDTDIYATKEVAEKINDVNSSGFSNRSLTADVEGVIEDLTKSEVVESLTTVPIASGLMSAALQSKDVLTGKTKVSLAGKEILKDAGIAVSASLLIDVLFS